ncbi:MAG: helix-turn-helix transcriptional regulator [bacterium]
MDEHVLHSRERERERERRKPGYPKNDTPWDKLDFEVQGQYGNQFRYLAERLPDLTPTEIKVATLIREGFSTDAISGMLCVSPNTIKTHRKSIRKKLGLTSNLQTFLNGV